jgi:rare lipoprotein A
MLLFALLAVGLALSGCAKKRRVTVNAPPAPAIRTAPGRPPLVRATETGVASWYGHPYHGRAAANGEIYDMEKLTAAHRTLPFGAIVQVTNLANDKSVEVRITDRGPFIDGRIIDLSHAAAVALDIVGAGLARVRLDVLSLPGLAASGDWFAVQAGAFVDKSRADRLRASLEREYGRALVVPLGGTPPRWRVLVGRESSEQAANDLARRIRREAGSAFVVRLDAAAALDANSPVPASTQE